MKEIYNILFSIGTISGCHQRADRSFFIKGSQFPVCARCTGAFCGYSLGVVVFFFWQMPIWLALLSCLVMFADWLLQRINVLESTNLRRFITGLFCGFGLMNLYLDFIIYIMTLFMI